MKGYGYRWGRLMDIVIGIAGAVAVGFIMRSAAFFGQGGMVYMTLVVILGAVILTVLNGFVGGRKRLQAEVVPERQTAQGAGRACSFPVDTL